MQKGNGVFVVAVLVVLVVSATSSGARVQVTARQGTTPDAVAAHQKFESPMVLEVPYSRLAAMKEREAVNLTKLAEYWCEDAHLIGVRVVKERVSKKRTEFLFTGYVEVRESHDRFAGVVGHLKAGEDIVARGSDQQISAEEGASTPFRFRIEVPAAGLEQLDAAGEEALLALALTLKNDN